MLATKGRLKVALLGYCGVLVVGLGMYGAFQETGCSGTYPRQKDMSVLRTQGCDRNSDGEPYRSL